jgi:hypothetical protein
MNPKILAVFVAARGVLIAVGAAMIALNLGDTHFYSIVMQVAGSIMVVGPIVWGIVEKFVVFAKALAVAVQAGMNITLSGKTVDQAGHPISAYSPDATPPKQVTVASAAEIIKDFAPSAASIETK